MELAGGGAAAAAAAPAPHYRPAFLPSFLAFMQRQWQADGAESVRLGEGAGSGRDWSGGAWLAVVTGGWMECGGGWTKELNLGRVETQTRAVENFQLTR